MKALLIDVDEGIKAIDIEEDLQSLQNAVGGHIEMVPTEPRLAVFCNEEGKLAGLRYNAAATDWLNGHGWLRPSDFIAGNLLICDSDAPDLKSMRTQLCEDCGADVVRDAAGMFEVGHHPDCAIVGGGES